MLTAKQIERIEKFQTFAESFVHNTPDDMPEDIVAEFRNLVGSCEYILTLSDVDYSDNFGCCA